VAGDLHNDRVTVLSRSERNPRMMTVQCDICDFPLVVTNEEETILRLGWQLAERGAQHDRCPDCQALRPSLPPRHVREDANASRGRLPDVVVIGAAKAGTTTLHVLLDAHPEIAMARWKEPRFFADPGNLAWEGRYRAQFEPEARFVGESSTAYTRAPAVPGVPERMAALVPRARLVYLVRDPVQRALASYVEERYHGLEPRTVDEAFSDLEDPYNPYVAASRYAEQLELFLAHYPREQVIVESLDDLSIDPVATGARVFDFLGVDPHAVDVRPQQLNDRSTKVEYGGMGVWLRGSFVGRTVRRIPQEARQWFTKPARHLLTRPIERPALSPELEERLRAALAPDAARFRALTGLELDDWSV
jgi:hypothetical protein